MPFPAIWNRIPPFYYVHITQLRGKSSQPADISDSYIYCQVVQIAITTSNPRTLRDTVQRGLTDMPRRLTLKIFSSEFPLPHYRTAILFSSLEYNCGKQRELLARLHPYLSYINLTIFTRHYQVLLLVLVLFDGAWFWMTAS